MSTVLKVHGPDGGSHALKLALGNTGNGISPEDAGAALRGEFLLLQKLNRAGVPNIPEPRAYEQSHEPPYLVEEYFPGQTLEQRLNRGRMGEGEAVGVISALLDTLEAMHRKGVGVIYRDLKPGNVILSESGAKLIDFGAGRKLKPGQKSDTVALGTPGFAAPEQWGKSQTDARSDVYSAGWLLYTMVTGLEPPPQFGRPDAKAMRGVSPAVQAAIEKATRLGPELRFQSAGEFKRALERTAILPQAALGSPIQLGFIKNPAATRRKPLLREKASEMHWTSGGKAGLGAAVGVVVWMGCLFSGYVDPSSTSLLKFLFDGLALTTTSAGLAAPN
ncbi:MAG: serine/threonine protein kinase, partial [Elusimicrobia bacterium]|nr:serine/threonine protein kinase [Elusimicrobiota bacterium]